MFIPNPKIYFIINTTKSKQKNILFHARRILCKNSVREFLGHFDMCLTKSEKYLTYTLKRLRVTLFQNRFSKQKKFGLMISFLFFFLPDHLGSH